MPAADAQLLEAWDLQQQGKTDVTCRRSHFTGKALCLTKQEMGTLASTQRASYLAHSVLVLRSEAHHP